MTFVQARSVAHRPLTLALSRTALHPRDPSSIVVPYAINSPHPGVAW
jgi:hypothetical protein